MLRTHTCGELSTEHIGQTVTLCGWVDTHRDHRGVLFVDLRDRYGTTQVVFSPRAGQGLMAAARALRSEYVISVTGRVAQRPEGTVNPKLSTGEIEIPADQLQVLNNSLTPPFQPTSKDLPGEDLRLKYRYLDLRRPAMQQTLLLRHRMIKLMRDYLDEQGFIDVETPMLGRSTPEGARDYLVPSRVQQGSFYALPQSPQLYKQLLMVAGYDRYMQVARCFRDEDLRADRQPEFTQLDLEMAFVDSQDVIGLIDGLVARLAKEIDRFEVTCKVLHNLRKRLGAELGLIPAGKMHFSWVVEFPMFDRDEETGGWAAMHHPFTSPRDQDRELLPTDPARVRAKAYDLMTGAPSAVDLKQLRDVGIKTGR